MRHFYILALAFLTFSGLQAQYIDGNNIKFGNEWIDFDAEYFKLTVNEDGIYRLTRDELENMGFPVSSTPMSSFALFNLGEELEIYTSGEGMMQNGDYIEFYGKKNRNEIDQYMFEVKQDQLNTEYSLITDNNAYYLSYNTGEQLRYEVSTTELSNSLPPLETYYLAEFERVFSDVFTKGLVADVRYSTCLLYTSPSPRD